MPPDPTSELGDLLDAVHAALRLGDLAALAPLTDRIEALLDTAPPGDAGVLRGLAAKVERNAACLAAARRGLRAARRRIAEVAATQAGLATYDGRGRRQEIVAEGARLARL